MLNEMPFLMAQIIRYVNMRVCVPVCVCLCMPVRVRVCVRVCASFVRVVCASCVCVSCFCVFVCAYVDMVLYHASWHDVFVGAAFLEF
jgi:hypothetical protein